MFHGLATVIFVVHYSFDFWIVTSSGRSFFTILVRSIIQKLTKFNCRSTGALSSGLLSFLPRTLGLMSDPDLHSFGFQCLHFWGRYGSHFLNTKIHSRFGPSRALQRRIFDVTHSDFAKAVSLEQLWYQERRGLRTKIRLVCYNPHHLSIE